MIKNDIEEKKEAEEMAIKNEDKGWKSPKELGLVE
jgi:hypothetical protein